MNQPFHQGALIASDTGALLDSDTIGSLSNNPFSFPAELIPHILERLAIRHVWMMRQLRSTWKKSVETWTASNLKRAKFYSMAIKRRHSVMNERLSPPVGTPSWVCLFTVDIHPFEQTRTRPTNVNVISGDSLSEPKISCGVIPLQCCSLDPTHRSFVFEPTSRIRLVLSGAIWIVVRKLTSTALIEKKKQSWVKVSTPVGSEQAVVGVCAGHPQFDTKVRVNDSILLEFSALDIHEEEVAGEYCERRLDRVWISPETVLSWSTP